MNEATGYPISYAQNPSVLRRARDFYSVYCMSSDGKNYQGLPCPSWDTLTDAVRRHWYTVALRSLQLEALADPAGVAADGGSLGRETSPPSEYVYDHIPGDHNEHLDVWGRYSGRPEA
jgi:hypothetical protein